MIKDTIENIIESLIFASRWILAPFYLGLAASLFILLIKFMGELFHIASHAFTLTESEVIVGVLALVDLALTGSLLIIVILSGYENFVSRIDLSDHKDWPAWMGTIDFSALKLKLLSSIVAISAIQLLKQFMTVSQVSDRDLMWLVIVHAVFVISSVLLALSDRIAGSHGNSEPEPGNDGGRGSGNHKPTGDAGSKDKPIMIAQPTNVDVRRGRARTTKHDMSRTVH
ncbi:MAG: TIGR00645 family protein [Alphaproteobacteria bacterium]|nr:TIGR00645 family protein [Alphaproteobacteria bacterium]